MTSSIALAGMLVTILQGHPLCKSARIVEIRDLSPQQFFFKIRASLGGNRQFQARIYYNKGHVDYAYQLFTDNPILRWDNKEEFPHLSTYPHHHHDAEGHVFPSPLTGNPIQDLRHVLVEIERFLTPQFESKDS